MQVHSAAVSKIAVLTLLLGFSQAQGQVAPLNVPKHVAGLDVRTHKFRPGISPDRAAEDASGTAMESEAAIALTAARQMNALLQDKQTRTAAQKKISSKLIYTAPPGLARSGGRAFAGNRRRCG